MDTQPANTVSPHSFASGVNAFEAPIPAAASVSLAALVANQSVSGNDSPEQALENQLCSGHLGIASALFRALRLKHPPTAKHCLRVGLGCSIFASHLELDEESRQRIEVAALLHDIGKLGVPDQVLNKPARLTVDEYELMERHLPFAVHVLESCCPDERILDIVRHSGTWYDGSRPKGAKVKGDDLPLGSRILAIQNAYDAMTTDMVYRRALPQEKAIAELLENANTQFDPQLVASFFELHSDASAHFEADVIRRWVETTNLFADGLWSLSAPISDFRTDTQTIFQQRLLESMHDGVVFVDLSARVLVWNRGAELLAGLSKESVHHKQWQPHIIDMRDMEGNAVRPEACPLLKCLHTGEESTSRRTVTHQVSHSKVAVHFHLMPAYDATGKIHGAIMVMHDVSSEYSLEATVENLHDRATKDALTGITNRAEFDRRHADLIAAHLNTGQPLGLVVCDIDRFKSINDTYGHQAGDEALVEFASLISGHSRGGDLVARYGGEEFVVLCPGCDCEAAIAKAEGIRRSLASTPQLALNNQKMTASFGVTELQKDDTPQSMFSRADESLYRAKSSGRNRVVSLDATQDRNPSKPSWFRWVTKAADHTLVHRKLKCGVPVKVVAEKIRGFISDNEVEVISMDDRSVSLCFDERTLPAQRRHSDRPIRLTMRADLRPYSSYSSYNEVTLIEVKLSTRTGRDRRAEGVVERADQLLQSFKSYLLADEC